MKIISSAQQDTSIKEIDEQIRNFYCTSMYSVDSFNDFITSISKLHNLSDIQTVAVAKRCLTGKAKLFFESLLTITSWQNFQSVFLDEFQEKITTADTRKLLYTYYLRKGENCTVYLIKM